MDKPDNLPTSEEFKNAYNGVSNFKKMPSKDVLHKFYALSKVALRKELDPKPFYDITGKWGAWEALTMEADMTPEKAQQDYIALYEETKHLYS